MLLRAEDLCLARMGKVVIGINVLQQFAAGDVAHTASLTAGIQFMRDSVSLLVKIVIILGFVDPHPPQNNGGPVIVTFDHALYVPTSLRLPGGVADVLPARDLLHHEQAQFIAGVQKMAGLRIVAGADYVASQFAAEDLGVPALYAFRHGVSVVRP